MRELVAIDLPGGRSFVEALQRVWEDGDAALPIDQRLARPATTALLDALAPARIIGGDAGDHRRAGVARPVEEGDALVMATSGTTGEPKGVVLTAAAVAASAAATSQRLAVDPARHRWLSCLPLNHVGGLSVLTRALLTGTPLEVLPGFDLEQVSIRSGPEVMVSLVPTTLARVGPEHFHTVVLGGSAAPTELASNVVTTYGLTETGSGVVYDGRPLDGVEVRIDPATSEISVRGPMLLRAYRSRSGDVDPRDGDGWLRTGDSGTLAPDGALSVSGRVSEMIVTGGENVWPAAVEALLRRHPAVSDVAVGGRPDQEWGQRVVAWVVPVDGTAPTLDQLRSVVMGSLAAFAAPRQLVLVDELPRTSLGKVRRHLLT